MQLDAYTLRKMAPRLLIAVVAVNLSIYLCLAAVDLTNIVGKGLGELFITPFNDAQVFDIDFKNNTENGLVGGAGLLAGAGVLGTVLAAIFAGGAVAAAAGAAVATASAALIPFLFLSVVSIGFVALAVLLTVILRQGILVFLIIVSPIAIALFVLPGTEKFFRQWWSIFLKTLMVYPIIAAIFAMSDILGAIIMDGATKDSVSGTAGLAMVMTGIIVIYAPLFLIPFAFKFAGGILGAMYDIAQGQTGKASGGLRNRIKQSTENQDSWLGGMKQGAKQRRDDAGLNANTLIAGSAKSLGALGRGEGLSGARSAFRGNRNIESAKRALVNKKKAQENQLLALFEGDDDVARVLAMGGNRAEVMEALKGQSAERFGGVGKDGKNYENAETRANREEAADLIMRAQGKFGTSVRKLVGQEEYAKATTAFKAEHGGAAEALELAEDVGGSRMLKTRALVTMKQRQKEIGRELGLASTAKQLGMQMEYAAGPRGESEMQDFQARIIDSAIEKASPSQLATMDNNGLAMVATRVTARLSDAQNGIAYGEDGKARQVSGAEQKAAVQMEVAHLANLRDSLNYSSPENRRKLAPQVFAEETSEVLELTERDGKGNIVYEDVQEEYETRDAGGNVTKATRTVKAPKKSARKATVTELIAEMEKDVGKYKAFGQARRTWGADGEEDRRRSAGQIPNQ